MKNTEIQARIVQDALHRRAGRPTADASRRKREAILDSAIEEFARAGFRGASMREIAAKAQISTRTLYNRYPDKLALFAACVELTSEEFAPVDADDEATLRSWLIDYTLVMHRDLMSERSRQISLLVYREGSEFDELRQIARTKFEQLQVAPIAKRLAREGIAGDAGHYLAVQFAGMALAEWQRRLIFGGALMSAAEIEHHARLVAALFLEGAPKLAQNWTVSCC
jgi:AcrR family transcriptional regulator